MPDLYAALGISKDAPPGEIKRAYRKAAKRAHPDGGGTRESFALVATAHSVLSDAQRRAHYDATGEIGEKVADQTEVVAMNIALNTIDQVLMEISRRRLRFEEFDLVQDAVKTLQQHNAALSDKIAWMQREGGRLQALTKRFSARRDDNRIGKMFAARIGGLSVMMVKEEQRAVFRAIEILKEHNFRADISVMAGW